MTHVHDPAAESLLRLTRRVVVGVDDTPEGTGAAVQAAALQGEDGSLHLVAVADVGRAMHAGIDDPKVAAQMIESARHGLGRAGRRLPWATTRLLKGDPAECILDCLDTYKATLVAVGVHRAAGPALGAVAEKVLKEAPCSVLVARRGSAPAGRLRGVVVGVDGSPPSATAAAVARDVARQLGASLAAVTGLGGKELDAGRARAVVPDTEVLPDPPVDALVRASEEADLIVVGSRGLHGLLALGSVSERVAHRAACSVLVVRETPTSGSGPEDG